MIGMVPGIIASATPRTGGPPSTPFAPSDIAGLTQWYDPSDPANVTLTDGRVSALADLSGNEHHASQSAVGDQPVIDSLNNRDALGIVGGQHLNLPDPFGISGAADRSLFVVFACTSLSSSRTIISYGSPITGESFHLAARSDNRLRLGTWDNDYDASTLNPGTDPHIAGAILDGTLVNDITVYLDGLAEAATGVPKLVDTALHGDARIGSNHGVEWMVGYIGEILLYFGALAEADRQKVEGYLAHKWGLQASLPAEHPYRSVAP